MTDDRPLRKRIPLKQQGQILQADPLAFEKNKCSDNARHIGKNIESTHIDFWIDRHYHNRSQHGDELGKREGIEQDVVHELVMQSVPHLMCYSAILPNFTFLNYNYDKLKGRAMRVVCQREVNGNMLNVVIEAHFVSMKLYEITIITAMQNEQFRMSDGQYRLELFDDGSLLRKLQRQNFIEVGSL